LNAKHRGELAHLDSKLATKEKAGNTRLFISQIIVTDEIT
jgi:hypothetical protein